MGVLMVAAPDRIPLLTRELDLAGQKITTPPSLSPTALLSALPGFSSEAWRLVVFDLDGLSESGTAGLSDVLRRYLVAMGDPVSFVIVDASARLAKSRGLDLRAQVVSELSMAKDTGFLPPRPAVSPTARDIVAMFADMDSAPDAEDPFAGGDAESEVALPALPAAARSPVSPPAPKPTSPATGGTIMGTNGSRVGPKAFPPEVPSRLSGSSADRPRKTNPAGQGAVSPTPETPTMTEPAPRPQGKDPLEELLRAKDPPKRTAASPRPTRVPPTEPPPARTPPPPGPKKKGRWLSGGPGSPAGGNSTLIPLSDGLVAPLSSGTKYIACWAPKGGTGKTSVAVGVGHYLSWGLSGPGTGWTAPPRVLLVDLDEFADAHVQSESLRARYSYCAGDGRLPSLRDLHDKLGILPSDWSSLEPFLGRDTASGLFMLPPQQNLTGGPSETMDATGYAKVLDWVSPFFDFVIFDCDPHVLASFNGLTPFALSRANVIVIVGDQTFPTITRTVRYFTQIMRKSSLIFSTKDDYIYVVNRYNAQAPSSLAEIKEVLDRFVVDVLAIPEDILGGRKAIHDGRSILFSGDTGVREGFLSLTEAVLSRLRNHETGQVPK